jgi:hypothetical protein
MIAPDMGRRGKKIRYDYARKCSLKILLLWKILTISYSLSATLYRAIIMRLNYLHHAHVLFLLFRGGKPKRWTAVVKDNEQRLEEDIAEDLETRARVGLHTTVAH